MPSPGLDCEIMELAHMLRMAPGEVRPWPGLWPAGNKPEPHTIGLCWQAGAWDTARSVPLSHLLQVIDYETTPLLSLQRGAAAAEAGPAFRNPGDDDPEILRTASLLPGITVVSVDTFVAHLAGAAGSDAAVLLKRDADWRWSTRNGRSVWYPSLRCFRQERAGDWQPALRAVRNWLSETRLVPNRAGPQVSPARRRPA